MPYSHTPVYVPMDFASKAMGAGNVMVDSCQNSTTQEITIAASLDPDRAINQGTAPTYTNHDLTVSGGGTGAHATVRSNLLTDGSSSYVFEVVVEKHDTNIKIGATLPNDVISGGEQIGTDASTGQGWSFVADDGSNIFSSYRGTTMVASHGGTMADGDIFHIEFNNSTGVVYVWRKVLGGAFVAQNSGNSVVNDTGANNGQTALAGARVYLSGHLYQTSGTNLMTFNFAGPFLKEASSGYVPLAETFTGIGNFCTWNPIDPFPSAKAQLSEGNTVAVMDADSAMRGTVFFDVTDSTGFYWETTIIENIGNATHVGIATAAAPLNNTSYIASDPLIATYLSDGAADHKTSDRDSSGTHPTYTNGDTISVAVKGGAIWFAKNGSWVDGANGGASSSTVLSEINAGTTTNAFFTSMTGFYAPHIREHNGTNVKSRTNWGQKPFRYTPPTNFVGLATHNMTSGYSGKVSDAIVTANDTEANIKATTEGAHSFSNWISFMYNRSASEQRIFYASDDASYYIPFADDGVLGRNSFPTLAGSNNWTGCAIAVSAATGVATGTISHTNGGGDSTAAHGLTSPTSRFSILISSQETSSHDGWFWFHPDMSSSHNIRLAQGGSEAQQNSKYYAEVTSSNAVVKSAAPSGTYRYIVFAENDLVSFYSYENVSGTDSAFVFTNNRPVWLLWGQMTETGGGYGQYLAWKGTHNPYNPWTSTTRIHNISTNEITGSADMLATGFKVREDNPGNGAFHQTNGQTTCGISIGAPFPLNNRVLGREV